MPASISRLRALSFSCVELTQSVRDILLRGHVRKKRQILKHISDPPLPRRSIPLALGVVRVFAAHHDASVVGIRKSSDAVEQRSFASARSAKKNRESRQRAKVDIQVKTPSTLRKRLRIRTSNSEEIAGAADGGTRSFFTSME